MHFGPKMNAGTAVKTVNNPEPGAGGGCNIKTAPTPIPATQKLTLGAE